MFGSHDRLTAFLQSISDQDELEEWYDRIEKIYDLKWFHEFSFERNFTIYIDFFHDTLDIKLIEIIEQQLMVMGDDKSIVLINEDHKQYLERQNTYKPCLYDLDLEAMKSVLKKDRYNYLVTKYGFIYHFALTGTSGKWLVYIPTVDNDVRIGDKFYNVEFTLFAIHKDLNKEFKRLFRQTYGRLVKVNNSRRFEMIKKIFRLDTKKNDVFFSKASFLAYQKDDYGYFSDAVKRRI